ncbi:MAG: D-alanyl-D-alanine carboxypeptidase, partial [Lachnospiraceae bacterium]|nr:D-alanyl-D-alanine carboxypeptidase [Lachnospiraceae bacterium]
FVTLMNQRAEELGCTNTHFANANGLPNEDHYISPHDMALIAKAFNDNDTCRRLASLRDYDMAVTETQPDEIHLLNHHKMYSGLQYAYEPVVWGKTGYTMAAGATLVTVAESNGMSLICVVMKDQSEKNYTDTRILFDFGFSNYVRMNIAENDSSYIMTEAPFFQTDDTTFGSTRSFISLDDSGFVVVPEGTPFTKLDSRIVYKNVPSDGKLADIVYYLDDSYVGDCEMLLADTGGEGAHFGSVLVDTSADEKVTFINVKKILPYIGLVIAVIVFIVFLAYVIRAYNFGNAMSRRMNIKKRRKRYHSDFDDIDF